MGDLFSKTYHPPGTAPGTLPLPASDHPAATVHLLHYRGPEVSEKADCDLSDCRLPDGPGVLWCHLQGQPTPGQLARLGELFPLHPLALEDIGNRGQRPKADLYDETAFVILNQLRWENDDVVLQQVSLFLGRGFVVTVHTGAEDPFAPIRRRIRTPNRNFSGHGAPYLAYAVIDLLVDQAFPVMEGLGSRIVELEDQVLDRPERATYEQIHLLRRELLLLRRQLWPTREVINKLMREGEALFETETLPYLRDVYDHVVQIMDLVESYREMTASLVDVFISGVNHRLNEVMKVLTIIATIFIPLTFLVGVYGMNFSHPDSPWSMPELYSYYGYPLLWVLMLAIVVTMLLLFRRRGWF